MSQGLGYVKLIPVITIYYMNISRHMCVLLSRNKNSVISLNNSRVLHKLTKQPIRSTFLIRKGAESVTRNLRVALLVATRPLAHYLATFLTSDF